MDKTFFLVLIVFNVTLNVLPVIVESKTCWDNTWYNNSSPTNRSEYESVAKTILATICSTGPVIDAQCKDNRGEPFRVHKIDKFNEYEATCDVTNGLICNPFMNTTRPCPDFAIQYGCACAVSTKGTSAVSAGITTPTGTNNPSGMGGNTTRTGTSKPSGRGGNTTPIGTSNPSSRGGNTPRTGTSNPSGKGGNNSRLQKGEGDNGATGEYVCSLILLLLCLMLTCI